MDHNTDQIPYDLMQLTSQLEGTRPQRSASPTNGEHALYLIAAALDRIEQQLAALNQGLASR